MLNLVPYASPHQGIMTIKQIAIFFETMIQYIRYRHHLNQKAINSDFFLFCGTIFYFFIPQFLVFFRGSRILFIIKIMYVFIIFMRWRHSLGNLGFSQIWTWEYSTSNPFLITSTQKTTSLREEKKKENIICNNKNNTNFNLKIIKSRWLNSRNSEFHLYRKEKVSWQSYHSVSSWYRRKLNNFFSNFSSNFNERNNIIKCFWLGNQSIATKRNSTINK